MNIDKGNQSTGGSAMKVIGNVANPRVTGDEYRIKTLLSVPQFLTVETDDQGRAVADRGNRLRVSRASQGSTTTESPSR